MLQYLFAPIILPILIPVLIIVDTDFDFSWKKKKKKNRKKNIEYINKTDRKEHPIKPYELLSNNEKILQLMNNMHGMGYST